MAIDQLTAKIYNKLSKANLAGAEGKVAICANKKHTCLDPEGVGSSSDL